MRGQSESLDNIASVGARAVPAVASNTTKTIEWNLIHHLVDLSRSAAVVTTVLALAGCAVSIDDTHTRETVSVTSAELATSFQATDPNMIVTSPWNSPGTVNVCFVTFGGALPSSSDVAAMEAAITESWQHASGLTFQFSSSACPSPVPQDWMSIFVNPGGPNCIDTSGDCAAGGGKGVYFNSTGGSIAPANIDYRTDIQIYLMHTSNTTSGYKLYVTHEVGHALGFNHEFARSDNTSTCVSNNGTYNTVFLTAFDPGSIMSFTYCLPNARTSNDLLSPLDQLGAEIVYPRTTVRGAHTHYGTFIAGGGLGGGLLVRTDDTLVDDWTFLGALPSAYGSFTWLINGSSWGNIQLPVSVLQGFPSNVWANFNDFLGRGRSIPQIRVIPNTGLHTALMIVAVTG